MQGPGGATEPSGPVLVCWSGFDGACTTQPAIRTIRSMIVASWSQFERGAGGHRCSKSIPASLSRGEALSQWPLRHRLSLRSDLRVVFCPSQQGLRTSRRQGMLNELASQHPLAHLDRLSRGWIHLSARHHSADISLARWQQPHPGQIDITLPSRRPRRFTLQPKAERMHVGAIDPECVSNTNELPKLTPQQAASWAWTPDAETWQNDPVALGWSRPATVIDHRLSAERVRSLRRRDVVYHFDRSSRRADFLSRCSAHAQRRRERHCATALAGGDSPDQVAHYATFTSRRAARC